MNILGNSIIILNEEMEHKDGKMGKNTLENGKMTKWQAKALCITPIL